MGEQTRIAAAAIVALAKFQSAAFRRNGVELLFAGRALAMLNKFPEGGSNGTKADPVGERPDSDG